MLEVNDFRKFLKIISNLNVDDIDTSDINSVLQAVASNEKATSQRFFEIKLDQPAYATDDYKRLRSFMIDWYASHRTISTMSKEITDAYSMREDELDELFRSFGYNYSTNVKTVGSELNIKKIDFLYSLINLYKKKGTPQALVDVLTYYGLTDIDFVEYFLKYVDMPVGGVQLMFDGNKVTGTSETDFTRLISFTEMTDNDPHWMTSVSQLETLIQQPDNKINLPVKSPYFSLRSTYETTDLEILMAFLSRTMVDQFNAWDSTGTFPVQDGTITILGSTVASLLEIYLCLVYAVDYNYTYGQSSPLNFLYYDGTNTSMNDIVSEYNDLKSNKSYLIDSGTGLLSRSEQKTNYQIFVNRFSNTLSTHFLDSTNTAGVVLQSINASLKTQLDAIMPTLSATDVLGSLLNDVDQWVKDNIGQGYVKLSYIAYGTDLIIQDVGDIINFFKPYRARLRTFDVVSRYDNRLSETLIVEDIFNINTTDYAYDNFKSSQNPVLYYKFNETSYPGTTNDVRDWSGKENHGTSVASPTASLGKYENAYESSADGTSFQYVSMPINAFNENEGTWMCHVYHTNTSIGISKIRIFNSTHTSSSNYEFRTSGAGITGVTWYIGNGTTINSISITGLTLDDWNHICFTWKFDPTSNTTTIKGYVNGAWNITAPDITGKIIKPNLTMTIGAWKSSSNTLPSGYKVDEFALYNRELPLSEITSIYGNRFRTMSDFVNINIRENISDMLNYTPNISEDLMTDSYFVLGTSEIHINGAFPNFDEGGVFDQYGGKDEVKITVIDNLASGVIGYWRMEENSWNGTIGEIIDLSGNGNHGTAKNGATTAADGKLGRGSSDLDHTTPQYIQMADSQGLRLINGGTIAAWINPASAGEANNGRIIDKGGNHYGLVTQVDGSIRLAIGGTFTDSSAGAITYGGGWQHVVVTFDSSGRKVYINGVEDTASGGVLTSLPADVTSIIRIGARATSATRGFDGFMDEVTIWDRVISSSEVAGLYNSSGGWIIK